MNLSEIFNSSFLVYLGILLLVVSFMVYYYESKMREQNHKITSMLSLVSSMAEELNVVRYNMNLIIANNVNHNNTNQLSKNNMSPENLSSLIEVSDDDVSDDSSSDIDDDNSSYINGGSKSSIDENSEDDDTSQDNMSDGDCDSDNSSVEFSNIKIGEKLETNDVKVLKIDLGDNIDGIEILDGIEEISSNEAEVSQLDEVDGIEELDDIGEIDSSSDDEEMEKNDDNSVVNETKEIHQELSSISAIDLKSINIGGIIETKNDEQIEELDYKKLSIGKLRNIVVEKGLVNDASKLKKTDLLKLLE